MTSLERAWVELMRRMTPQQRCELARGLTVRTMELAHQAIERAYPELSPWARRVKLVEVQYGAELAGRFERWLMDRGLLVP